MIDRLLFDLGPAVVAVTVVAFIADWSLTLIGARAYTGVRDRWSVEGSYEMNPAWESAVERGRWLSYRVVAVAGLVAVLLSTLWLVGGYFDSEYPGSAGTGVLVFALGSGALLLVQAPTLMNHVRNLVQFRSMADPTAVTGQLRVSRWFGLDLLSWFYLTFAALWLVLYALSLQAFFLGGTLGSVVVGIRFRRLAAELRAAAG